MRRVALTLGFLVLVAAFTVAQTPTKAHSALVHCVAISPDGKLLASAGFDNTIKIWDINGETLKERASLPGHTGPVYAVAFSTDGKLLVSSSLDKTARVWNVADKKMTSEIKGHTDIVDTVAISPDGKILATGSADKSVKLWNATDGKETKALGTHTGSVYAVAISPDGKFLASAGGGDNLVKVWDIAAGKEAKQLKGHEQAITGLVFTGNTVLATISLDRSIRVWNTADGKETKKLGPTTDDPYGISWASKAKRLAVCGYSGKLTVWDLESGKSTSTAKVNSPGYTVAIDGDGKTLFSGHDNGTIAVTKVK